MKIILDTDIGSDIDDVWALTLILAIKEIEVKLICISTGDVQYKAKLVAKILSRLNRTDIPIAIGEGSDDLTRAQSRWLEDFDLDNYKGEIIYDCSEAIYDVINENKDVKVVEIGPFTNIANFYKRYNKECFNFETIAMGGAIYKGYLRQEKPEAECNIITDVNAADIVVKKGNLILVPLDVCRDIFINGNEYQQIRNCTNAYCKVLNENYDIWQEDYVGGAMKFDIANTSSILYDLAPVFYLVKPNNYKKEELFIKVTEDGKTVISNDGNKVVCLTEIYDGDFSSVTLNYLEND